MRNVVIRRSGALGDVVLTTPIVNHFLHEYPDCRVHVITGYPSVFTGWSERLSTERYVGPVDKYVDLDGVYERNPHIHIVDAYAEEAEIKLDNLDKQPILWGVGRRLYSDTPYAVIHPAVTWPNRTVPQAVWQEVVDVVTRDHMSVIVVGSERDLELTGVRDYRGKTYIHNVQSLIHSAEVFIGPDSGLLHVAATTDTPIVGVFTCAKAELRLPYSNGTLGAGCVAVVPDLPCYGCHHDRAPPVIDWSCPRGDLKCVTAITAAPIIEAVNIALSGTACESMTTVTYTCT